MPKVLIIGGSGFLGTKLSTTLGKDYEIIGTFSNNSRQGLSYLDIRNEKEVHKFIEEHKPDTVIHTAALSDPDFCEQNKELTTKINYLGAKYIAEACEAIGSKLIYCSTVYVYDGEKGNYTEEDSCHPINHYGATKYRGEIETLMIDRSASLRFDFLYGFNGYRSNNGFFQKIIKGGMVKLNGDQKRQPLFVDDCANAIKLIMENDLKGLFNLGGPDNVTKYRVGKRLGSLVEKETKVIPIPGKAQVAIRPINVSVDTTKARKMGIKFHSIDESLEIIKEQLKK